MSNLTPLRAILLVGSIATWTIAAAPESHGQNALVQSVADAPKIDKIDAAADLRREETELRGAVNAHPNDANAHLKLADYYVRVRNYPSAEAEARIARRIGDRGDEADALLAWILYLERKTEALLAQIKPAEREPQSEGTVRLSLGLAHFRLLELKDAEPLLRDAVRLDPSSLQAHLALADFLLFKGQLPDAREQYEAAHAIAPASPGVLRLIGELHLAQGNVDDAIAEFTKVIEANPRDATALLDRAKALISENKFTDAQRDLDESLKFSKNPRAIYLTALILAREGKMAEANVKLAAIQDSFGLGPEGYYLQGSVRFWLGQYEQADAALAKAQGRQPNAWGIRRLRAEIALRHNAPSDAVRLLEPAIEDNPSDQENATVLARAYIANGHPERALEVYKNVAGLHPEKFRTQPLAVGAKLSSGGYALGLAEIDKINADRRDAAVSAAFAELRHGDIEKASSSAEALTKRSPDDPMIQNLLGSVRIAQKRLPEAEEIFRDITKKRPAFTEASLNLANVLVAEKRPDEAMAVLNDLIQRNP